MSTKVGVIGAGNIGYGICINLLKNGFDLVVYDVRPEPLKLLKEKGATIASNPGDLGNQCKTVFVVVLDYKQNIAVLEGKDGLIENMAPGSLIFTCSTISPSEVKSLGEKAKKNELRLIDCPVSGGFEGAKSGKLTLMIGANKTTVKDNLSALEAISENIYFLNNLGAGAAAKSVNNLLCAIHIIATAEAMLLAAKNKIDLDLIYDIISKSAGQSWIFEHRAKRMASRDFSPRGVLRILLKDTHIMSDLSREHELVLPLTSLSQQIYQAAVNQGLGDEDDSAVIKVLERLAEYSLENIENRKPSD